MDNEIKTLFLNAADSSKQILRSSSQISIQARPNRFRYDNPEKA